MQKIHGQRYRTCRRGTGGPIYMYVVDTVF